MAGSIFRYLALVQYASLILAQNACVLTVPPNPLSAQGLATPYFQTGCDQRMFADQASFVEAAIFDPAANSYTLYHPLVVNKGDVAGKNFIAPVVPTVPAGAVVALWFGTNGGSLTLTGNGVQQGLCTNGLPQNGAVSIFGQFAYCNAVAFFTAAQAAVANGGLVLPPPGTANDGTPCPITRDFRIVDMDPNDNVLATYLLLPNGMLAQNTPANAGNNTGAQTLANGSDEGLVGGILDPLVGCTPFRVPSLTAPTGMSAGLPNNELVASKFPPAVVALVPMNDPMCVITNANNGAITQSTAKTSLYRAGVGQPPVSAAATGNGTTFCMNFPQGCIYINNNQNLFSGAGSPMPAVANNLFTFMAQRWANSFAAVPALGCVNLLGNGNLTNPIQLTANANGVVTAVAINTAACQAILAGKIPATSTAAAASATATKSASGTAAAATATATRTHRHRFRQQQGTKRMRVVRRKL